MKNKNGTTEDLIEFYLHTQQMSYCFRTNSVGDSYEYTYDKDGRELTYKHSMGGTTSENLKPTDTTPDEVMEMPQENIELHPTFVGELQRLINRYSLENESNTPDFILAKYMYTSLINWQDTCRARKLNKLLKEEKKQIIDARRDGMKNKNGTMEELTEYHKNGKLARLFRTLSNGYSFESTYDERGNELSYINSDGVTRNFFESLIEKPIDDTNKLLSSVGWLIEQLPLIQQEGLRMEIEQSKAMHKEEIIAAFEQGYFSGRRDNGDSGINYYNDKKYK